MAFGGRKITNMYHFPSYSILDGFASLIDFNRSECSQYTDELLSRSDADAMNADWEAVIEDIWWAINDYESRDTDRM